MSDTPKIPKLELEKFTFSPPGPMGWNMAEYEQLLENPDKLVLNESTVNSQLESLLGIQLVELSLSGELKAKEYEPKEISEVPVLEESENSAEKNIEIEAAELEEESTEDENTEDENTEDENTEDESTEDENTEDESTEDENTEEESTEDENTEDESTEEESTEEEIMEEPTPKTKVTIIVSDNVLKKPWITPSISNPKNNSK